MCCNENEPCNVGSTRLVREMKVNWGRKLIKEVARELENYE